MYFIGTGIFCVHNIMLFRTCSVLPVIGLIQIFSFPDNKYAGFPTFVTKEENTIDKKNAKENENY